MTTSCERPLNLHILVVAYMRFDHINNNYCLLDYPSGFGNWTQCTIFWSSNFPWHPLWGLVFTGERSVGNVSWACVFFEVTGVLQQCYSGTFWVQTPLSVPSFSDSPYLTLYNTEITLRQTPSASHKGVHHRERWLYSWGYLEKWGCKI